ncbi:unnamed protein product [Cuscuta campestris]|uniref:Transposase (putative) gypsy type domain-containing protein n=1 Tax=Cuscuta campestris TaxID=132261 RepID=A0A484NN61_9ASTE|nr:unnamed protein product [Cuscuta campestris]
MGFQPQLNDSGRPMVSGMQPPQRLLQYISSYILRGRAGNHPQMSKDDSMLIYAILKPVKVNWGKYIMSYMHHCRARARALPYPILLTFLLKKKGFVFANEDMKPETPFWRIKRETVMRAMHDTNEENRVRSGPSERRFATSNGKVTLPMLFESLQDIRRQQAIHGYNLNKLLVKHGEQWESPSLDMLQPYMGHGSSSSTSHGAGNDDDDDDDDNDDDADDDGDDGARRGDCSSEDSNSSSSTGSSSPESTPGQVPNSSIPDPHPVNQMPGETFVGRDDPVDDEPGPYDPEHETRDAWEERLHAAGYFPLPTFYVLDIPFRVSKIALNKIRRRLPDGYTLLYEPNWPNIVEPHREDRIGFHTISLDAGIVFPLRPLLTEVCHAFRILPGQITPNAHRYLHSFVTICTHLKIFPSLRLFLFCFEVLPGESGCEGFVFFKARTGRKFIFEVPQSNRGWKEKFVFIEFPPFVTPLAGLKWNDHLLDQEYAAPASSPDLEANLEVLMRGDPFTGRIFHYGSWVWRVESGGEGTSQAHEAAGRGVPSSGNAADAEGQNHPDMEFEEFAIPDDQPAGETGGSQANTARTFLVNPETVEILDKDEPQDNRSKGKEKEKTGRRMKKVATTHPSYAKKRARSDPEPAGQTIEEAFIILGLRLKEIGSHTVDRLGMGSPSEVDRLKREKEEMALILKSQADELIRLSGLAGAMKTEISQLKEENGRLMDEVSEAKREMAEKEETFPGRAAAWVEEEQSRCCPGDDGDAGSHDGVLQAPVPGA